MKNFCPSISELTEISENGLSRDPAPAAPAADTLPTAASQVPARGWILYDGECQYCIAAANQFQRLFARRGFCFLPLQTPWVHQRLGLVVGAPLDEMRVLTVTGGDYGGAEAVLFLAKQVWWLRPIAWIGQAPGIHRLIDAGYRWIAARRGCTHLKCAFRPGDNFKDQRSAVRRLQRRSAAETSVNRRTGDRCSLLTALVSWGPPFLLTISALLARPYVQSWAFMWFMVGAIFIGCKWLTLQQAKRKHRAGTPRQFVYLFLWPGMDAGRFLGHKGGKQRSSDALPNIAAAVGKIMVGALLLWGIARYPANDLLAGWIGMTGMVLITHFGLFGLAAACWQVLGMPARPIMNAPWKAAQLSEFWGRRWNRAFQQLVIDTLFRPLAGSFGAVRATLITFFISGLLHELVISLPARAGYGLPTAYFLLQGWGVIAQRTPIAGRLHFSHGVCGRLFTLFIVAVPAIALFHPPFVRGVIIPFMRAIGAL